MVNRPRARLSADGPSPGAGSFFSSTFAVGPNIMPPSIAPSPAFTARARAADFRPRPTLMTSR